MEAKESKISQIEEIEYNGNVYDIHMNETPHTFFANDILVHNSEFALQNGKTNDEIETWVDNFNNHELIENFIPKYNNGDMEKIKEHLTMEIEYEKDMERIFFSDSKKRYYGIIRKDRSKYIRGMNIIRKDAPAFLKEKLNILSELAVNDMLEVKHLHTLRRLIEIQPLKSIGVVKAFSRRFDKYEKTQPQHLKASKWANEILGTKISHIHNPYMFYVVSKCEEDIKPRERNKAICVLEEDLPMVKAHPELFEIDYNTYFSKQVLEQISEFDSIESVKNVIEEYKEGLK